MDKEKSRFPVYQTEKRQTEIDARHERSTPPDNVTTAEDRVQGFFESILPKGAENAISTVDLMNLTGLSDQRVIRQQISNERAGGAVILSGDKGYYLPDDGEKGRQEVASFVATVTAKGVSTIRATKSARAFLNMIPGQLEIGGVADGETEIGG